MDKTTLQIYKILQKTQVEGPGVRYCIWVQGCSRRCKGCFAKATWDFDGGTKMAVQDIIAEISATEEIEGVTFLGGEPFEQPEGLYLLAKEARKNGRSVLCFTGFTYEQLLGFPKDSFVRKLLSEIDLLIDSPFEEENFDLSRPWVGSSNQRYLFLTNRYSEKDIAGVKNKVEARVGKDGKVFMNGMGDFHQIKNLIK